MLVNDKTRDPITAYPLCWPLGVARAKSRKRSDFSRKVRTADSSWVARRALTNSQATHYVMEELRRLGVPNVVISTNVELRLDGLPYSNRVAPKDPGVALYFDLEGEPMCLSCDKWDRVADNLRALSKWIEATRGQERWVGHAMMRASFTGFRALPAPGETSGIEPWSFLAIDREMEIEEIESEMRKALLYAHPDKPTGSREEWDKVQTAVRQVRAELGAI